MEGDFALFVPGRLFTVNGERKLHRHARSELVRWWRDEFARLARDCAMEPLDCVDIIVKPVQRLGRLGDAGGHAPVAKAAIDGLVDAGVLKDDDGRYVATIIYHAPQRGPVEGLRLALQEVE